MSTFYIKRNDNDIVHYGVLGMKWGVRRYQNADGSLTNEGIKKYGKARQKADISIQNYKEGKDIPRRRLDSVTFSPGLVTSGGSGGLGLGFNFKTRKTTKLDKQLDKAIKRNDTEYIEKIIKVKNKEVSDDLINYIANERMSELKRVRKNHIITGSIAGGLLAATIGYLTVSAIKGKLL